MLQVKINNTTFIFLSKFLFLFGFSGNFEIMTKQKNSELRSETRPPIVVVLGHIDHGKTTLLDFIRKTKVVEREAGQITQSIGAYEIEIKGKKITFIDTPGHQAFSKMRSRGVDVADLAILIIACDEGIKKQTQEAISLLKEIKLPFIIALNKTDKKEAEPERIIQQLLKEEILLEKYGGNIPWQKISAKTGQGIDELLEVIFLMAEMEELEFNPKELGKGVIIEVKKTSQRGIEVSAIVKDGILKQNLFIKTKTATGRIKCLENFLKQKVKELFPCSPAKILGFIDSPLVGEEFNTHSDFIEKQEPKKRDVSLAISLSETTEEQEEKENLILKADNLGSLEVLEAVVKALPEIKILDKGIGNISENDLKSAISSKAIIIGFNVSLEKSALILGEKVKIITADIIYKLIEDLEKYFRKEKIKIKAEIEILAVFRKEDKKQVIGGKVIEGKIKNNEQFEIERAEKKIGQGKILNLQRQKENVSEIEKGQEAGLSIEGNVIIKQGDKLIFKE